MAAWLCLQRRETWSDIKCLRKLIRILIITAPVLHAQSLIPKPVTFRATTTTGSSYYVGEPLTVYCKSHGLPGKTDPLSGLRNLVIIVNNVTQIQCNEIGQRSISWYQPPEVDISLDLNHLLNQDCYNRTSISYHNFIFNLTEDLVGLKWTCTDNYYGHYQASKSSLIIKSLKEPPQNLIMTLDPEQIIENQEITARCTSTSSDKYDSPFKYELVRGENSVVINNGRYTPSAEDRSGFKVKCTDTKNPDWRAIDDIEHVIDVTPIYVDFGPNGTAKQKKAYSAEVKGDILVCDIIGHPSVEFYWSSTKEEADFEGHTGRELQIVNTPRVHAEYENVTCTGSVSTSSGKRLTRMMEWHIDWEGSGSTSSSSSSSSAGIYGGVFGGLSLIALIAGLAGYVLSGKMRNTKKREPKREKKGRSRKVVASGDISAYALDTPQKRRRTKHKSHRKSKKRSSKKHSTKVSDKLE